MWNGQFAEVFSEVHYTLSDMSQIYTSTVYVCTFIRFYVFLTDDSIMSEKLFSESMVKKKPKLRLVKSLGDKDYSYKQISFNASVNQYTSFLQQNILLKA